jgi:hypothetical protein
MTPGRRERLLSGRQVGLAYGRFWPSLCKNAPTSNKIEQHTSRARLHEAIHRRRGQNPVSLLPDCARTNRSIPPSRMAGSKPDASLPNPCTSTRELGYSNGCCRGLSRRGRARRSNVRWRQACCESPVSRRDFLPEGPTNLLQEDRAGLSMNHCFRAGNSTGRTSGVGPEVLSVNRRSADGNCNPISGRQSRSIKAVGQSRVR